MTHCTACWWGYFWSRPYTIHFCTICLLDSIRGAAANKVSLLFFRQTSVSHVITLCFFYFFLAWLVKMSSYKLSKLATSESMCLLDIAAESLIQCSLVCLWSRCGQTGFIKSCRVLSDCWVRNSTNALQYRSSLIIAMDSAAPISFYSHTHTHIDKNTHTDTPRQVQHEHKSVYMILWK